VPSVEIRIFAGFDRLQRKSQHYLN